MSKTRLYYIIVTGPSRSGKDTFIKHLHTAFRLKNRDGTQSSSSIGRLYNFLSEFGVDRHTEEGRKILAETKTLLDSYDFLYTRKILERNIGILETYYHQFITQIREKNCIDFTKKYLKNKPHITPVVVKILSKEAIKNCPNNHADREAIDIEADYTYHNDGTLEELEQKAYEFVEELLMLEKLINNF